MNLRQLKKVIKNAAWHDDNNLKQATIYFAHRNFTAYLNANGYLNVFAEEWSDGIARHYARVIRYVIEQNLTYCLKKAYAL